MSNTIQRNRCVCGSIHTYIVHATVLMRRRADVLIEASRLRKVDKLSRYSKSGKLELFVSNMNEFYREMVLRPTPHDGC